MMTNITSSGGRVCRISRLVNVVSFFVVLLGLLVLCVCAVAEAQQQQQQQQQDTDLSSPPPPYLQAKCSSSIRIMDEDHDHNQKLCCDNHVDIAPGLGFHWSYHHKDRAQQAKGLFGAFEYGGNRMTTTAQQHHLDDHWLGFGFSPDGSMINSRAMIGLLDSQGRVESFDLVSHELPSMGNRGGVQPHHHGDLGFHTGYMTGGQGNNLTMHFHIQDLNLYLPKGSNVNGVVNMIYAVGKGKILGHHQDRGSFRLAIENCPSRPSEKGGRQPPAASSSSTSSSSSSSSASSTSANKQKQEKERHSAAFAAHGFFAILAFLFVIPVALVSTWFRILFVRYWIYVHVICNMLAAFFVTVSISAAFGGMVLRSKDIDEVQQHDHRGHMSIIHHWIGLLLFLLLLSQVIIGFNRPLLKPEDDNSGGIITKRSCCGGMIPLPSNQRETWHCLHRTTAFFIFGMALYQLQSGLRLFTTEYGGNTEAILTVFWVWVAIIAVAFVVIKWYLVRWNKKTKSEYSQNIMPQMRAEQEDYMPRATYYDNPAHERTSQEFSTVEIT